MENLNRLAAALFWEDQKTLVVSGDTSNYKEEIVSVHEYWLILSGTLHLSISDFEVELMRGDLAILRKGVRRHAKFLKGTRAVLARE